MTDYLHESNDESFNPDCLFLFLALIKNNHVDTQKILTLFDFIPQNFEDPLGIMSRIKNEIEKIRLTIETQNPFTESTSTPSETLTQSNTVMTDPTREAYEQAISTVGRCHNKMALLSLRHFSFSFIMLNCF